MSKKEKIVHIQSDIRSLDRPAWTQNDGFGAFKHKQTLINGRTVVIENYYVHSRGVE